MATKRQRGPDQRTRIRRGGWPLIIDQAAEIVRSYETGVTLRQLFYRLVAAGTIVNSKSLYAKLSKLTAEARRAGTFPDLVDDTSEIKRYGATFTSPEEASSWLADIYRRDRTEGQGWSIYLGSEKAGLVRQLERWFDRLGTPIIALGGWGSQTFKTNVARDIRRQGRPAVLLYCGDLDPSGAFIGDEFAEKVGRFTRVERLAVNVPQLVDLPFNPYPEEKQDSNTPRFIERYGRELRAAGLPEVVQYEVDAIEPRQLRALYHGAIARYTDSSLLLNVWRQERAERQELVE
jgi:hypothetical protein